MSSLLGLITSKMGLVVLISAMALVAIGDQVGTGILPKIGGPAREATQPLPELPVGFQPAATPPVVDGQDADPGPQSEPGPQGQPGPEGEPGPQGKAGPQGEAGPAGEAGPQGGAGPQGLAGGQGLVGAQGLVGPQGDQGASGGGGGRGSQGPQGVKGDTGATGPQGPAGETSETGVTADSLDFTELSDSLIIDAATSITRISNNNESTPCSVSGQRRRHGGHRLRYSQLQW